MKYTLVYMPADGWWHLEIVDERNALLTEAGLPLFDFNGTLEACVSWIERFNRVEQRVDEVEGHS